MTSQELLDILREIQINKCETRTLEIKAAEHGCPKRLYADSIVQEIGKSLYDLIGFGS